MTATAAPAPPAVSHGLDRPTLVTAGVVLLGTVMSILDTTIVNVALDALSRDLDAPLSTTQWVATGYLLSLAMVIPLSGWLSERFGSKRIWLFSVALFAGGSALCGMASSAGMLIAFRVLQGVGGGMIMPVGMSILAQTVGPSQMPRVMSVLGVPMLLGPTLGPVIGGLLVDSVSWRWIFYVNVPIAMVALVLGVRLLDERVGRADPGPLDWRGLATLSPGLAAIVFGLSESERGGGLSSASALGPVLAGLILVAVFVRHALGAQRPIIDVRLLLRRGIGAAAATTFMVGAALFGAMLVLPLYYQVARGESALHAGLLMAPQGIGAALTLPFASRVVERVGGGRVAVVGCAIVTLATLPLVAVSATTPLWLIAALLVVRGIGMGASMMPAMTAAYRRLQASQVPRATSALNSIQRLGGSVGAALLAVVLQHEVSESLPTGAAAGGGGGALGSVRPGAQAQLAEPLAAAFGHTFLYVALLTAVALVPAALLARTERGP